MAALSERERCLEIERDLNRILLSPNSQSSSTPLSDAKVGLGTPFTFTALGESSAAESDHAPRQRRQQQKPPARRDRKRNPPPARRERRENQDAGGPEGPLLPTPSSAGPQADVPASASPTMPKPDRKPRQDHRILVPSHRTLNNSANAGKGTQRFAGNDGVPMMPGAQGPRRGRDVMFLQDLERRLLGRPEVLLGGSGALFGRRNLKNPDRLAEEATESIFLNTFKSHCVLPLKKRSKRFPRAIFYCHLCHRHFDDNWYVEKHLEQEQHQLRLSVSEMRMDVKNIPHPVKVQVKAIDSLLQSVSGFGLTKEKVELRKAFAEKLEASLRETLPDIKLTLHGSSVNGFGLYDSEVNLDLSSTGKTEVAELLVELSDKITQDEDNFSSPERDFLAKVPRFRFVDGPTDLKCEISLNNSNSIKTSRLLADYASLDPRVQSLGVIFRYWGHVCKLDRQERGTLPPHAYPIMVIYFLQQCKPPVVPVLHELTGGSDSEPHLCLKDSEWKWKSTNNRSLGDLWCELLRFYAAEFRLEKHVVCIRRLKPVLISEKKWNKRYIAIEDPYSSKRNLARSIPSEEMNLFLKRALRESAIYFHEPQVTGAIDLIRPNVYAQPRCTDNSEFGSDSDSDQEESKPKVADKEPGGTKTTDDEEEEEDEDVDDASSCSSDAAPDTDEHDPDVPITDAVKVIANMTLDDEGNSEHGSKTPSAKPHKRKEASTTAGASEFVRPGPPMTQQNIDKLSRLSKEDFDYQFTLETLSNGREPPMICTFCMKKGHLQENCPDQILPQLVELPPMTRGHIMILNDVCVDVMRECLPRPHEEKDRNMLLHELESLIRELYSDARLTLYGSSCNGFGLARSDLDICLTFDSSRDGKELCHSKMIPELAKKLRAHPDLDRIVPITTAKVPIVKFYHRPSRLEGDISLYNTLAQHNTRLLKVYSDIDKRVRVLGYTLKHFAKTCDIGDASRGSLSSYAYILMVLYYLQQCKPPVIPVLQELYPEGEKKPELIIEGWNAWFFDDIDHLQSVWSEFGQNNESVGELWLGLLRFYTEVFDFRADVVCIRQRKRITRLQKSWTSRCIAIEDPFELDHNLGSGVSRKMNAFIMKALIKGRALFGTPFRKPPAAYDSYIGYFFDRRQLVDGQPPNDRGCRLCSKIGHRVKDCPRRRGANNNGSQNDRVQGGGSLLERSRDFAAGRGRAPQDNWRQPQDGAYQSRPYQRQPPQQQQQLQQQQQRKARPLQSHQGRNRGPEEPQHSATVESHLPGSPPAAQQLPSPAVAQAQLQRALQDMMRGGPYPPQWAPTGPPPFRGQAPTRPPPFPQGANGQPPPHPDVQALMYRMRYEQQQQQQEVARNQHAQWRHRPPGPPRQHMEPHWAVQPPNPPMNLASGPAGPGPGPCLPPSPMPNPAVDPPQQPVGFLLTKNAPGPQLPPQFHCGPPPRAPFTAAGHPMPLFPAYAPQCLSNWESTEQDKPASRNDV
ncbi:terminal uridylyltransferase 7 isoform X1 [Ixodes scapularis]|uniref:terminal uridylyltransferase 7 isoform X1 n=1 Tax=Ixodes scapularis TaxID=6945 RepID=UPI001A9FE96A|nr:terminal uridylyltransferase 7 isoform X1 [Ixodes scapularis]